MISGFLHQKPQARAFDEIIRGVSRDLLVAESVGLKLLRRYDDVLPFSWWMANVRISTEDHASLKRLALADCQLLVYDLQLVICHLIARYQLRFN